MTPRSSIVGQITSLRIFNRFLWRAVIFGGVAAVFAILAFFPERYRAAATVAPTDPQTLGLSGTLSQLGAINTVFGNQAAIEIALRVGNGQDVRERVIKMTNLAKRLGDDDVIDLHRWLTDRITVRSLRGGIVLIEMNHRDPVLAKDIVSAYADATRERLAVINRNQTAFKRKVLVDLVDDASQDLAKAQAEYDQFRLSNHAPSPDVEVTIVSGRIALLQTAIKAAQIEIDTLSQQLTPDNPVMRQKFAELAALRKQLAEVKQTNVQSDVSVGRAVASSSQLFKLERNLLISRSLYDGYLRYLQGTAVEDMTSAANIRVLEPASIDTERQFWLPALAAALAVLLFWAAVEFYRLRPPVGASIGRERAVND